MFSGPVPYSDYNHVVDIAPFAPVIGPPPPSTSPICSTGGVTAACAPNTGQAVAGYMNFEKPWATSTFGTNGVSLFPTTIPWATPSYKPPSNSSVAGPVNLGASFGRNFHAGMTQAWNFSVEQQLSNVMALRVAYVGSQSYHQSYVQDDNYAAYSYCTYYNNANCPVPSLANKNNGTLKQPVGPYSPTYSTILEYDSGATADYHSLQATFQRHMSLGLQAQSSFTWQKTMDVASAANIAASQNGITDPLNLRWSRGVSSASIPFTWTSATLFTAVRISRGRAFWCVKCLVAGRSARSLPGSRALLSASAVATATSIAFRSTARPFLSRTAVAVVCRPATATVPTVSQESLSRFAREGDRSGQNNTLTRAPLWPVTTALSATVPATSCTARRVLTSTLR